MFAFAHCEDSSDKDCSSFKCPDDYSLVDDADKTVCGDSGCTKDLCCDKDGEPLKMLLLELTIVTYLVCQV